jgi:hypothetical protein
LEIPHGAIAFELAVNRFCVLGTRLGSCGHGDLCRVSDIWAFGICGNVLNLSLLQAGWLSIEYLVRG